METRANPISEFGEWKLAGKQGRNFSASHLTPKWVLGRTVIECRHMTPPASSSSLKGHLRKALSWLKAAGAADHGRLALLLLAFCQGRTSWWEECDRRNCPPRGGRKRGTERKMKEDRVDGSPYPLPGISPPPHPSPSPYFPSPPTPTPLPVTIVK